MNEDHLITVKKVELPDEIEWMNIKYSSKNRKIRKIVFWLLAIILILIAFTIMVYLKDTASKMKLDIENQSSICPSVKLELKNQYFKKYNVIDANNE